MLQTLRNKIASTNLHEGTTIFGIFSKFFNFWGPLSGAQDHPTLHFQGDTWSYSDSPDVSTTFTASFTVIYLFFNFIPKSISDQGYSVTTPAAALLWSVNVLCSLFLVQAYTVPSGWQNWHIQNRQRIKFCTCCSFRQCTSKWYLSCSE